MARGTLIFGLVLIGAPLASCTDSTLPRVGADAEPHADIDIPTPGIEVGPVAIEDYCEARSRVDCHRLDVCRPASLRSVFGDVTACETELTLECHKSFVEIFADAITELGVISFDATKMGRALEDHSKRHCGTLAPGPSPEAGAVGLVADDAPCGSHSACVSTYCKKEPFEFCGVCRPPGERPPSACSPCALGEACYCEEVTDPDAGVTRDCSCRPETKVGQACVKTQLGCEEGSSCIDVVYENARASLCHPMPFAGQACGTGTGYFSCVGDAICALDDDDRGLCKAPVVVGLGETCTPPQTVCDPGLDCRQVCVARAQRDETCVRRNAPAPDAGTATCEEGPCLGTCQGLAEQNEFCTRGRDCEGDLGCYFYDLGSGTCTSTQAARAQVIQAFRRCM